MDRSWPPTCCPCYGASSTYRGTFSARTHSMATDYSAFEGWEIRGRPSVVTVRGRVTVRDGKFVGTRGTGRMVKRERRAQHGASSANITT